MYIPDCDKIKKGSTPISKVYQGNRVVWQETYTKVYYQSSNGEIISLPWDESPFRGTTVVDNVYEGNRGYWLLSGDIGSVDVGAFELIQGALTWIDLSLVRGVIGERAFSHNYNLSAVTIGTGVTYFEDECFYDCGNLIEFNYLGTIEQYGLIRKIWDWSTGLGARVAHCTDGDCDINYGNYTPPPDE